MGERRISVAKLGALIGLNGALAAAALRQRSRVRAARGEFHQALGALSEAVTITDGERRIRYANRAAAETLGSGSPGGLLAAPPGPVRAEWGATKAAGSPLRGEDIPSSGVVGGLPAEPLLTHIVHR